MKKIRVRRSLGVVGITVGLLVFGTELHSISTVMNHRLVSSSPLLYKQVDYADPSLSLEIEPWVSGMFNPAHAMTNLGINGQSTMELNQLGLGNINPEWINLASSGAGADYTSTINLKPESLMFGALVHFYKQWEHFFFDVRSAVINCRTQIKIAEAGGQNGGFPLPSGQPVYNAYDAFTQSDWNYGKFGELTNKTGLDNVQLMIGGFSEIGSVQSCKSYVAGFALVEAPTGHGTQAEWLFEPQVGTNHWALGAGFDYMLVGQSEFSLVVGGNYRYIFSNWETRSFDLTVNGQWSRYLEVQSIADIDAGVLLTSLPGINFFTQDALINGRNEVTAYARVQKRFEECLFELSYNFLYSQQETITQVHAIPAGYGIYDIATGGGDTTASTATIANATTPAQYAQDTLGSPITLVTSDLNLLSGAASKWMSNTIAARLQRVNENSTWGIGGSVDLAMSAQAVSAWSVWFNVELLLPN
jgi:hypothetical protein